MRKLRFREEKALCEFSWEGGRQGSNPCRVHWTSVLSALHSRPHAVGKDSSGSPLASSSPWRELLPWVRYKRIRPPLLLIAVLVELVPWKGKKAKFPTFLWATICKIVSNLKCPSSLGQLLGYLSPSCLLLPGVAQVRTSQGIHSLPQRGRLQKIFKLHWT